MVLFDFFGEQLVTKKQFRLSKEWGLLFKHKQPVHGKTWDLSAKGPHKSTAKAAVIYEFLLVVSKTSRIISLLTLTTTCMPKMMGLGKGGSFSTWPFLVSMLDLGGVYNHFPMLKEIITNVDMLINYRNQPPACFTPFLKSFS